MRRRKKFLSLILITIFLFSMGTLVHAQDENPVERGEEKTHLYQHVDEFGNITESRLISDSEFQAMKNASANARSGTYMQAKYLERPKIEIAIFYSKEAGLYFRDLDYVFTPASNLWQHQNVVVHDRHCTGTVLGRNGYTQDYWFYP